jgi:hypothetical protein
VIRRSEIVPRQHTGGRFFPSQQHPLTNPAHNPLPMQQFEHKNVKMSAKKCSGLLLSGK